MEEVMEAKEADEPTRTLMIEATTIAISNNAGWGHPLRC
jgi:hypothetical protein